MDGTIDRKSKDELTYPVLEDRKMGWIASDDVGALVAAAIDRPELAGNRYADQRHRVADRVRTCSVVFRCAGTGDYLPHNDARRDGRRAR